jgi:hypothetical protein
MKAVGKVRKNHAGLWLSSRCGPQHCAVLGLDERPEATTKAGPGWVSIVRFKDLH